MTLDCGLPVLSLHVLPALECFWIFFFFKAAIDPSFPLLRTSAFESYRKWMTGLAIYKFPTLRLGEAHSPFITLPVLWEALD